MNLPKPTSAPVDTEWEGSDPCPPGYRLVKKLWLGSWAENYLVKDLRTLEPLVLKRPVPEVVRNWPALTNRMSGLALGLRQFSNPRVLPVRDHGRHDGRPFLLFPFCEAGNLWIRMIAGPEGKLTPRPAENLSTWLQGIAGALDFLHGRGCVHGDVKPANILFDARGEVFLDDTGLKRSLFEPGPKDRYGNNREAPGTARYMAPESVADNRFHCRSDQFSLALIAWEWLTGRTFFKGETLQEVKKIHGILRFLPRYLPQGLMEVFRKALSRRPEERYGSCQEFTHALLARAEGQSLVVSEVEENFDLFC